jgi:hypothetical protein
MKRKRKRYLKLPRTAEQIQERMRQSRAAGKHVKRERRQAWRDQERLDNL